jgi:uncharacterized NAD(P)/FAD-binding protein YdhS
MNPTRSVNNVSTVSVAVVGAGAGGTLTALHLLRALRLGPRPQGRRTPVVALVDPSRTGQGTAYRTTDRRHLLNVPAGRLSALPDEPDHFVRWAAGLQGAPVDEHDHLPRALYGTYLAECLAAEASRPDAIGSLRRLGARVRSVGTGRAGRTRVLLDDGSALDADDVVLALGVHAPGTGWAPPALLEDPGFVADPWAPGALERVGDGPVLLVGTGLTMADVAVALHRPGRTLHALSRRGLLPRIHASRPVVPVAVDVPADVDLDTPTLREAVRSRIAEVVRAGGDWRSVVDGMRPLTAGSWARLCGHCRGELLTHDAPHWDVLRHRMPRATGEAVGRMRAAGDLTVRRGEVVGARRVGGVLEVVLADATVLRVDHVVNCTGPVADPARTGDPLLLDLLDRGLAVPGPQHLGLATALDGRVLGADGSPGRLWTLGSLRRGDLWETTAIPEIRAHAVGLATSLLDPAAAAVPHRRPARPARGRRPRDAFGLPMSTTPQAAAAYDEGLARVLRVQDGAAESFARAVRLDPGFALGHAALALLGHEGGADTDVTGSLARAVAALDGADEREADLVRVVAERVRDTAGTGARALVRHLERYPRDALAVSAAVPTIAFSGVTDVQHETWDLVERLAPAYGDHWWFSGLLAFVRQDQRRYDEAAALAAGALQQVPESGHAAHAMAHVHYETGDHAAGLAWLDPWIATSGRDTSHRAHYSWHAALHELSLGDLDALRRRWSGELAPPHVTGVRALVDSASLLWRCRMTGAWSDDQALGDLLARVDPGLLTRPATPFTALHAALALAAADDRERLLDLREHAARAPGPVMRDVVVQLCDALVATVDERWDDAVRGLRLLGPWLVQLGGSAAQREIVEDTLLHALVRAHRCDEARALLEVRLDRRPSPLDRRRLAGVPAG